MQEFFKKCAVAYLAGALGGLAFGFLNWLLGQGDVLAALAWPRLFSAFTWAHIAKPVLQGSLWALLMVPAAMLLPLRGLIFGLLLSLIPSLYTLLVYYPRQHHGLSPFTSNFHYAVLVLILYAVWGIIAGSIYISHYKS